MCGRFSLGILLAEMSDSFGVDAIPESILGQPARRDIRPTEEIVAVRILQGSEKRHIGMLRWGLIPGWTKGVKKSVPLINARSETLMEKASFRDSFKQRRCLILADGFYEWKTEGKRKEAWHFCRQDHGAFAFAGIWDRWVSPDGKGVESCAIITTEPNNLVRDIHDRMPVILNRNDYELWLNPGAFDADRLWRLFEPNEVPEMARFQKSPTD